ncbi:ribosome hibernation-promoting factor, HPF/YfiA family [Chloroflexota bacterium]
MQLQITGKGMDLSPEVRRYIERKLGKLERYLPSIDEARVEVSQENTKSRQQHFIVQVSVDSAGTSIRSEERGADLFTAIDKVAAITNRRIEHYKGKLYDKRRGKGSNSSTRSGTDQMEIAAATGKVVKVKRFDLKPMAVDEAIEQMELLGHAFFLFFNLDSDNISLLYRRKDNNYGLIESSVE